MKKTLAIFAILSMVLTGSQAETNQSSLLNFILLHADPQKIQSIAPTNDNTWLQFQMSRTELDQKRWNSMIHPQTFKTVEKSEPQPLSAPLLTVSQSERLALFTSTAGSGTIFQTLSQIPQLLNFNATYTFLKNDSTFHPGMSLQLVVGDFVILNRYDVEWGPAYTLVDGLNCIQFGFTIKFIETPSLQRAASKIPQPLNLSRFYIFAGAGTVFNQWSTYNFSLGIGTQVGN